MSDMYNIVKKVCSKCGTGNESSSKFCLNCGIELNENIGNDDVKCISNSNKCLKCGTGNESSSKFCLNCVNSLNSDLTEICSYCASQIPVNSIKCKYCGEYVSEDSQYKNPLKNHRIKIIGIIGLGLILISILSSYRIDLILGIPAIVLLCIGVIKFEKDENIGKILLMVSSILLIVGLFMGFLGFGIRILVVIPLIMLIIGIFAGVYSIKHTKISVILSIISTLLFGPCSLGLFAISYMIKDNKIGGVLLLLSSAWVIIAPVIIAPYIGYYYYGFISSLLFIGAAIVFISGILAIKNVEKIPILDDMINDY
ncbi:MAG: double zinc ribbon domain-containing protein [Methanobacteriaceae archaeon]